MVFRDRPSADVGPKETHRSDRPHVGIRYRLHQNLGSISDAVTVQTDQGNAAFQFEIAQRELEDVLVLRDMAGSVRCLLHGHLSTLTVGTDILSGDGRRLAHVTRTPVSAVRDRFEVDTESGGFWLVIGDVGNREFTLDSPKGKIAEVSRRWFKLPNTFGVEVAPGQDDALVLAVTTAIDQLTHDFHH